MQIKMNNLKSIISDNSRATLSSIGWLILFCLIPIGMFLIFMLTTNFLLDVNNRLFQNYPELQCDIKDLIIIFSVFSLVQFMSFSLAIYFKQNTGNEKPGEAKAEE